MAGGLELDVLSDPFQPKLLCDNISVVAPGTHMDYFPVIFALLRMFLFHSEDVTAAYVTGPAPISSVDRSPQLSCTAVLQSG